MRTRSFIAEPGDRTAVRTPVALRRAAVTSAVVAMLLGAGLVVGAGAAQERGWATLDGRDWTQFEPGEKEAYVAGFLAGAASAATNTPDTAVIKRTVDSLYRAGGLRFPFAPMVYATQLNEFYWWDNHIPIPLYLALPGINQRLRQQSQNP